MMSEEKGLKESYCEKLEDFLKDGSKNELIVDDVADSKSRSLIHEWARSHNYLSRTWYKKNYRALIIRCSSCTRTFEQDISHLAIDIDYEVFFDLRQFDISLVCSHCNSENTPSPGEELSFPWVAGSHMLLMKKAIGSYESLRTKEGSYRKRHRGKVFHIY